MATEWDTPPPTVSASPDALIGFESRAMGSPLRILLNAVPESGLAQAIWTAIQADIEHTESVLSRFRAGSPLAELNRIAGQRRSMSVPARLRIALACAERARRMSAGLFEPRVLGALAALKYPGPVPESLTRTGGWTGSIFESCGGQISLAEPLDLDGIGKGLALRWALKAARPLLTPGMGLLIEAGGDLAMIGQPPSLEGSPQASWSLGVEDPGNPGPAHVLAALALRAGGLATSSSRLAHWISPDGKPVHHLIDPRTGQPGGEGLLAVTVAHADPAWAEVWTKVLFFAGARDIGPKARALGLTAWWVRADNGLEMTPAARPLTRWMAGDPFPAIQT